jgi:hypothetical protein
VFKFGTLPDGSIRVEVNPETHRRKVAKERKAKTEVARARQTLNLAQDAFAGCLVRIAALFRYFGKSEEDRPVRKGCPRRVRKNRDYQGPGIATPVTQGPADSSPRTRSRIQAACRESLGTLRL